MVVTQDFILIHVPKTGGTFLSEAIKASCRVYETGLPPHAPHSALPASLRALPAIGFVRDPWQWYVSWWEHQRRHGPQDAEYFRLEVGCGDFDHSLRCAFARDPDYYSDVIETMLAGCEVGRFERLREDFTGFLSRHRVDNPALMDAVIQAPPLNVGQVRSHRSYYSDESVELVGRSWVAQEFGYESERRRRDHFRAEVEGWEMAYRA